jgi:putative phosphoribosyl transferase
MHLLARASMSRREESISIQAGAAAIEGLLALPAQPKAVVVFSHGSGSGRHSPRNQFVAAELRRADLATLLVDLLTSVEDQDPSVRFDIALLTERLMDVVGFVRAQFATRSLPVGLFGASTGAASALRVAARMPKDIAAVVCRGGRPDLAGEGVLLQVKAPTLLIVGGRDYGVVELNRIAHDSLGCERELAVVPGATHLFEEPGTLEQVAQLAKRWFARHLVRESSKQESSLT